MLKILMAVLALLSILGVVTHHTMGSFVYGLLVLALMLWFICLVLASDLWRYCLPVKKGLLDRTRKLSRRQQRVTEMVAMGMKNREIAHKLGIGVHVVRNYISAIYDKIGVNNRVELALWYEARRHERTSPKGNK